jgi:hypothetical protein
MARLRARSFQSLLLLPPFVGFLWLVCSIHCALPH